MAGEKVSKYSPENPEGFMEPVVRCVECQRLNFVADLHKNRTCLCGCPRFRTVANLESKEVREMLRRGVDQEYLELFGCRPSIWDKARAYVGL